MGFLEHFWVGCVVGRQKLAQEPWLLSIHKLVLGFLILTKAIPFGPHCPRHRAVTRLAELPLT